MDRDLKSPQPDTAAYIARIAMAAIIPLNGIGLTPREFSLDQTGGDAIGSN